MPNACFIAPDWLIDKVSDVLIPLCAEKNIDLDCHKFSVAADKFSQIYRSYKNVITWGFKMPPDWYTDGGRNVLFIENGYLRQRSGVYIDDQGFFINSSIVKGREWVYPFSDAEWDQLVDHVESHYDHWHWAMEGNPDGPIFVAIQQKNDAPCKYHFAQRKKDADDPIDLLLYFCHQYLPDREVIVKPHPRFLEEWSEKDSLYKSAYFRKNWSVFEETDACEILTKCSALVTINSTLATEAQFLGIPVAVLGEGLFSKSDTVLDCSKDPEKLAGVLSFKPDLYKSAAYLYAVFRHHILYDKFADLIKANKCFLRWRAKA